MRGLIILICLLLVGATGCLYYPTPPAIQQSSQLPTAYIDSISPSNASAGEMVSFTGHGTDPDGTVVGYKWRSSIDGDLSTAANFQSSSMSPGTHTITLIVQDNNGNWSPDVSSSLTITGGAAGAPVINSFIANPGSISLGGSSQLSWNISGASTVTIDQGIGTVGTTGVNVVYPVTTTNYTLTATNASGSVTASAQITVTELIPVPTPVADEPDLFITGISRSGSTVSYTITNQGTAAAGPSVSQLVIDGVVKATDPVNPLAAGASSTESFSYSYSCSDVSDSVAVQADKDNVVAESNEGNNVSSVTWSCLIIVPLPGPLVIAKPDLIITDVKLESGKVKYTIKNQGTVSAASSTTAVYINGSPWSTDATGTIAAGASSTQSFAPNLFLIFGNTYVMKVVADKDNVVAESNETNNTYSETWGP